MTIDVNVKAIDEEFLEEYDEIIEDTMIQIFVLHPKSKVELSEVQSKAKSFPAIFYTASVDLLEHIDKNCVALQIRTLKDIDVIIPVQKPYVIEEALINDEMSAALSKIEKGGIILNASKEHKDIANTFVSLGPGQIEDFEPDALQKLDMDRIVLQSSYPDYSFDEIQGVIKMISDTMFRPEQSIIARATKNSLTLFGLR